jgi:hypothetical protein
MQQNKMKTPITITVGIIQKDPSPIASFTSGSSEPLPLEADDELMLSPGAGSNLQSKVMPADSSRRSL